jgi:hypothetical protein
LLALWIHTGFGFVSSYFYPLLFRRANRHRRAGDGYPGLHVRFLLFLSTFNRPSGVLTGQLEPVSFLRLTVLGKYINLPWGLRFYR